MCSTPKHGCQIFPLGSKHFACDHLWTVHICLSSIKIIIIIKNNKENQYLLGCNIKLHVQCKELEFLHKDSRRLVTLLNDLNQHCPFGWKQKSFSIIVIIAIKKQHVLVQCGKNLGLPHEGVGLYWKRLSTTGLFHTVKLK